MSVLPATQAVETGKRVPLSPVMPLSRHHFDHSYLTPLHCNVFIHQAFPYPSELWRPLRGGSQCIKVERGQRDNQRRCGYSCGGSEGNRAAVGRNELMASVCSN